MNDNLSVVEINKIIHRMYDSQLEEYDIHITPSAEIILFGIKGRKCRVVATFDKHPKLHDVVNIIESEKNKE